MDDPFKTDDPSQVLDSILTYCTGVETSRSGHHGDSTLQLSDQVLKQLKEDGCDMVRSLECSSQLRSQRQLDDRNVTQKQCVELTQHSERQIETSQTSLQAKWDEALITTVPQEIHELTIDVREICSTILGDQDQLIVRLRHELDRFEAAMQHEIEQETEDIAEMRRRMRTHLDTMRETYRSELHTIDEALGEDYMALLRNHSAAFDQMLAEWSAYETKILHDLMDYSDLWHQGIEDTENHHFQETKQGSAKLTADIQTTELELERIKCDALLSNAVLDYNNQVLKIREEERATRKQQLKRQINRAFDQYRRLRDEWDALLRADVDAKDKMLKEMDQLRHENILLERKFSKMKKSSLSKLQSVCLDAEQNIARLLNQLSAIDEKIFTEVLERPWDYLVRAMAPDRPLLSENSCNAPSSLTGFSEGRIPYGATITHLEKDLRFLLAANQRPGEDKPAPANRTVRDQLMKSLGLADDHELDELLDELAASTPASLVADVTRYMRRRVQPMDEQQLDAGSYLATPATARRYFAAYKQTVPQARIDLWNMLARGLIEYERILKDRLTLAAQIQKMRED